MRDSHSVRLGGLAANLARVNSFAGNSRHMEAVQGLHVESEHFIEWLAQDTAIPDLERLAQLQIELAIWQHLLPEIWTDLSRRREIAEKAQSRSEEVLEMSGLLRTSASP